MWNAERNRGRREWHNNKTIVSRVTGPEQRIVGEWAMEVKRERRKMGSFYGGINSIKNHLYLLEFMCSK
jgi:hypothetical protein